MGSEFGKLFRVMTWGESHGPAVGAVIEGCPPGVPLDETQIQRELDRRRPGQSSVTSARAEPDRAEILSGVFEGRTSGTPVAILVRNKDPDPGAYVHLKDLYRPSHADFTYEARYGIRDWRGGGRASARETVGRVAAGAVAKEVLKALCPMTIIAYVRQVHRLVAEVDPGKVRPGDIERSPVRCPDPAVSQRMVRLIERTARRGDSLGGIIEVVVRGAPAGLGEPVFDRLDADLAKAMLSIPATKGVEIGSGFACARMKGSEHNDPFFARGGRVRTRSNRSGGIQGGISNGEDIVLRVAFKPTATIRMPQETVTRERKRVTLEAGGRHDPCVLTRAVPVVEAMAALVVADHYLRFRAVRPDG